MPETPTRRKVMISSTSLDLPEHRKQVIEACLRMDCTPLAMETLTAADADAVEKSVELVNDADIYLGIFAHRYGYVPRENNPQQISVTEMEYDRAVERGIPRLIFFIGKDVLVHPSEIDTGPEAEKLKQLKARIGETRVAGFFETPKDLRGLVIQALQEYRERKIDQFHYVCPIPAPPEPYVAHPYTLLQSRGLVGRRDQLNWLTDWVAGPKRDGATRDPSAELHSEILVSAAHELDLRQQAHASRLFFLVAIGGMGKSALTWHWFQEIAQQEMHPLAGRMWWSFYESDAHFENFVIRSLAYTTRRTIDEVRKLEPPEREAQLLAALDREPHLVVLDGLERILIAYARADASRLADDDLDQQTANYVARAYGLPPEAAQSLTGQHRLRLTVDPRAGSFLRKLSTIRASRILVSTRLFPADLQTASAEPVGNCFAYFLSGLSDDDALQLWRAAGARGSREVMLPLFESFDKHPLLIQALASVVAHDRRAPGDFDAWQENHPDFNPYPLLHTAQRKSHVLAHALRGLDDRQTNVLHTIAAFRMPATYDTLAELFVTGKANGGREPPGSEAAADAPSKADKETIDSAPHQPAHAGRSALSLFDTEPELDAVLAELEDRGLLGWERRSNRYDLHPIVRGVVFSDLDATARRDIYSTLREHFEPIQTPDHLQVESLDDLTPAIELYHTLIELGRYEDAFRVFRDRLSNATLWRLSASRLRVELVERLFPDGVDRPPRLSSPRDQSYALNSLAQGYQFSGQPGAAVPVFRQASEVDEGENDQTNLSVDLYNLSYAQRLSGDVRGAEASARAALRITRERKDEFMEGVSLCPVGLALAVRAAGQHRANAGWISKSLAEPETDLGIRPEDAVAALERSLRICQKQHDKQGKGLSNAYLAEVALRRDDPATARTLADRAWELATVRRYEADFIRAARLQGTAAVRAVTGRLTVSPVTDRRLVGRASGQTPSHTRKRVPGVGLDEGSLERLTYAHERLHHALTRARGCQLIEEELPTLIALAELHWLLATSGVGFQPANDREARAPALPEDPPEAASVVGSPTGDHEQSTPTNTPLNLTPDEHLQQARHLLDDVWDPAERGPYPLFHADALNMLGQIERTTADGHEPDSAEQKQALTAVATAARRAYELAWLQGPPFAYARGLTQAEQQLHALGVTPPDLPPYDPSKYDPMPEVEIDPPEEDRESDDT